MLPSAANLIGPSRSAAGLVPPRESRRTGSQEFDSGSGSAFCPPLFSDRGVTSPPVASVATGRLGFRHPPQQRPSPEQGWPGSLAGRLAPTRLSPTRLRWCCSNDPDIFASAGEFIRLLPMSSRCDGPSQAHCKLSAGAQKSGTWPVRIRASEPNGAFSERFADSGSLRRSLPLVGRRADPHTWRRWTGIERLRGSFSKAAVFTASAGVSTAFCPALLPRPACSLHRSVGC